MTKYIVLLAIVLAAGTTGCGTASQAVRPGTVVISEERHAEFLAAQRRAEALITEQVTDEERALALAAAVEARRAEIEAEAEATARRPEPEPAPVPQPVVEAPRAPPPVVAAPVPAPRSEPDPLNGMLAALGGLPQPSASPRPVAPQPHPGMGYMAGPPPGTAPTAPMSYDYVAMPESMAMQLGILASDGTCGRCLRVRLENVPMSRAVGLTVDGVRIRVVERDMAVPYPGRTTGSSMIPTIESTGGIGMTYVIPLPNATRVRIGVDCLTADRAQSSDRTMSRGVSYDAASAGRYRTGVFRIHPGFCR